MTIVIRNTLRDAVAPFFRRPKARQVAALCYRLTKSGKEVLLITSRDTGRWIIPKGWPMRDKTDAEAALQEAWEEAGVRAELTDPAPVGRYGYDKVLDNGDAKPVETTVYPIEVEELAKRYPEVKQRKRKWLSPKEAAKRVDEPELKALLRTF